MNQSDFQGQVAVAAVESESINELLDLILSAPYTLLEPTGAGVISADSSGEISIPYSKYLNADEITSMLGLHDVLSHAQPDCQLGLDSTKSNLASAVINCSHIPSENICVAPIKRRQKLLGLLVVPYSKQIAAEAIQDIEFCITFIARCLGRHMQRLEDFAETEAKEPVALTDRQLQVTKLVVRGHTNSDIAAELHVSVGTVKADVGKIMRKLGVPNRASIYVPKNTDSFLG